MTDTPYIHVEDDDVRVSFERGLAYLKEQILARRLKNIQLPGRLLLATL